MSRNIVLTRSHDSFAVDAQDVYTDEHRRNISIPPRSRRTRETYYYYYNKKVRANDNNNSSSNVLLYIYI